MTLAKMGRPKSDNPKEYRISVRFTEDEHEKLKKCAAENNLTITQTIRKGVNEMLDSKQ